MLTIRTEQFEVFERAARQRFEDEMVAHSKDFSPRLCAVIGEDQLRVALRAAIARAEGFGFSNRGPIRLFIELTFLHGSGFYSDPQYPGMAKTLSASADQMERAEQMHLVSLEYLEQVAGPGNANVRKALAQLLTFARSPLRFSGPFEEAMLDVLIGIFPQKAAYVGEARLRALIAEAIKHGREQRFSTARHGALLVALMFAFGHACTDDPLYPWIARTLNDDRIADPAARAARLEKKAITWLEHVVGGPGAEPSM
jgi:hypothetical protein